MAVKFPFVSAFLCERVLQEKDGIVSAIRIVDVFQIPEDAPSETVIQFFAVVSLRTVPVPDEEVRVGVTIVNALGERQRLPDPSEKPFRLSALDGDASVPNGISLIMQLNIKPKNMGTCFVEIDVDGEVVTRIPFTIRQIPKTPAQ
jgi:hypothetical protein